MDISLNVHLASQVLLIEYFLSFPLRIYTGIFVHLGKSTQSIPYKVNRHSVMKAFFAFARNLKT
jgi:hypothetical protein